MEGAGDRKQAQHFKQKTRLKHRLLINILRRGII